MESNTVSHFPIYLFEKRLSCSHIEPGKINDMREAAVNNTRLACVAAAHRCHTALRYCSAALMRDISSFVRLFDQTLRENTPPEELLRYQPVIAASLLPVRSTCSPDL